MRQRVVWPVILGFVSALVLAGCGSRSRLLGKEQQSSAGVGGSGSGNANGSGSGNTTSRGATTTASSTTGGPSVDGRKLDKLDILLAVDDSASMADKQRLLMEAVPDLIGRLANPLCADDSGRVFPELTPPAGENCPRSPSGEQLMREFLPVFDVHVGVVTSSLGSAGGPAQDKRAHLLGSLEQGANLSGLTPEGFLAWEPGKPQSTFEQEVGAMMQAVGEGGSGYEAPLEAALRFLVDPEPYDELLFGECPDGVTAPACIQKHGVDATLLEQRAAFLRPDSVVVVVILSDEDDCSASVTPTSWQAYVSPPRLIAKGTSVCAVDPEDPCCAPCTAEAPGCDPDPACADPYAGDVEQRSNLRCFEQKRRFGRDALYPIERYKNAVSQQRLCPERLDLSDAEGCSELVENPLFLDLKNGGPAERTPQAVFMTFIVGVPWQDIAVDPLRDPSEDGLVYRLPEQLEQAGGWELLIGDTLDPPLDPLMLQSVQPRSGIHPITGETLAGPEAWPVVNSINGHDRTIMYQDDLQYSCTFPLPELRQCMEVSAVACDCSDPKAGHSPDNPVCQDPMTGEYSLTQHSGKAYPAKRHVLLARELGQQSVLSSICARNTQDRNRTDYAYRPAVAALVSRIAPVLVQPE